MKKCISICLFFIFAAYTIYAQNDNSSDRDKLFNEGIYKDKRKVMISVEGQYYFNLSEDDVFRYNHALGVNIFTGFNRTGYGNIHIGGGLVKADWNKDLASNFIFWNPVEIEEGNGFYLLLGIGGSFESDFSRFIADIDFKYVKIKDIELLGVAAKFKYGIKMGKFIVAPQVVLGADFILGNLVDEFNKFVGILSPGIQLGYAF